MERVSRSDKDAVLFQSVDQSIRIRHRVGLLKRTRPPQRDSFFVKVQFRVGRTLRVREQAPYCDPWLWPSFHKSLSRSLHSSPLTGEAEPVSPDLHFYLTAHHCCCSVILIESKIALNSLSLTSGPSCGPDMLIMNKNAPRGTTHIRVNVLNSAPSWFLT